MKREQKATAVEEIATQIGDAEAIFAIDYRGISVPQAAELRAKLREADASFRVVKNRLTKLAADKAGQDELKPLLEGPTALTFVRGDTATAAKAISTFNREHHVLTFKGGFMEGLVLDEEKFTSIARLPSREVLNGQFAGVVASPLTGLVRGLGAMVSGLAIQLQQIAEQGLIGEQPVPAEQSAERTPTEEPPAEQEEPPAEQEEPPAEQEEPPAEQDEPPAEKGAPEETSEESETEEE